MDRVIAQGSCSNGEATENIRAQAWKMDVVLEQETGLSSGECLRFEDSTWKNADIKIPTLASRVIHAFNLSTQEREAEQADLCEFEASGP